MNRRPFYPDFTRPEPGDLCGPAVVEIVNPVTRTTVKLAYPMTFRNATERDTWMDKVTEHLVRAWELFRDDPAVLGGPHDQEKTP